MNRCVVCQTEVHTRIKTIEQRDYSPEMVEAVEVLTCGCDDKETVVRSIRVPQNSVPNEWL